MSSGSTAVRESTPDTAALPISARPSAARLRPTRAIGVRVAATTTASAIGPPLCSPAPGSGRDEDRDGEVVAVDDRPRVEGGVPAGLVPLDPLAPALGAEGPRIVGVLPAVQAVPDEEPLLFGRLPPFGGVALERREVEADGAHLCPTPLAGAR